MHRNVIVRLVTYYVAVILVFSGLFWTFPVLGRYVLAERARQGARAMLEGGSGAAADAGALATGFGLLNLERSVPVLLSIVAALLVALPVTWVYRWTRSGRGYDRRFAQTLLVVPIAIALVVFLVKDSLALAFSLAGIVAAVRFRTTLDEPLDAVYLFIVIGTGLAAGVQLLFVALLGSIAFNTVTLTVWGLNVGAQPAVLDGWRLVEPAPAAATGAAPAMALRADTTGGPEKSADPYNAQLRLHVTQVEAAQRFASVFLDEHAKQWRMAQVVAESDGASVIEFDLRLKKSVDLAAFTRGIEQGDPHVTRVELMRTRPKRPSDA